MYLDNTKPVFMGGSLTYYPHPLNQTIDIKPTNHRTGEIKVKIRNLARLQQISKHAEMRFIKFDPDLAVILARGAIPLNFSIINRFLKKKNEHNYQCNKYLTGKTFHLFPGLERIWEGMDESIVSSKSKNSYEKSIQYFLKEMENFINIHFKHLQIIKIFYLDTTNTGRTLNQTLNVLQKLSKIINKNILLDVHGVLNKKGNKLAQIKNKSINLNTRETKKNEVSICCKDMNIRITVPKNCKKIPYKGQTFDRVKISSWHYYSVDDLFTEDLSDVLAATITDGYLVKYNVFRDFIYLNDEGEEISGSSSCEVSSKKLIFDLAEWFPYISTRKSHLNLAKQKKDKRYPHLPMKEMLKILDPKK